MASSKLDGILRELPQLSPDDRAKVSAACSVLGTKSRKAGEIQSPAELLWDAYQDEADARGLSLPPSSVAKSSAAWARFEKACRNLDLWINTNFRPADEGKRWEAYSVVGRCIVSQMTAGDRPLPLISNVLMNCAASGPSAVESQYPGYAKAGLLQGWVV